MASPPLTRRTRVIHPVAGFAGGAVIDMADGSKGNRIRDLAILNDLHGPR